MSITITSLTHPTMIAKIREGLYYAHKGQGEKMNGHGNRVYIQNAKGHNIMRLDWRDGGYIVWGSESKDITTIVQTALYLAHCQEKDIQPLDDSFEAWDNAKAKPAKVKPFHRLLGMIGMATLLTGCSTPGVLTSMLSLLEGFLS